MTTQRFYEVEAKFFSDCSGDSILAPLTGAQFRQGREAASEFDEISSAEVADKKTMGMSCLIQGRETTQNVTYTPPEWAAKLNDKLFEHRMPNMNSASENFWYLELGGNRDSIGDTEQLRDELVALAAGTWDYVKNSGHFDTQNWDLDFLGFLPGKRESRRMVGEHILTQPEISAGTVFEDEVAFGGWPLDDHFPDGFYHRGHPNTYYTTPAPYSIPYRSLYSKNVDNLFFAGRNISTTHMAMSSTRVMATCGLVGEAVGKAASLAVQNGITPQDVYLDKCSELQEKLMNADCFLPSKIRSVSETCRNASLTGAADTIRNGQDRAHAIYGTEAATAYVHLAPGSQVTYSFAPTEVTSVHLVFSSDLNRETLNGDNTERTHTTRANTKLDSPQLKMPDALCKEFKVLGEHNGKTVELLHVTNNRKRCYHLAPNQVFDRLILMPISGWGGATVDLISFDFNV